MEQTRGKKIGRPKANGSGAQIGARWRADTVVLLREYARQNGGSSTEALRQIVEHALKSLPLLPDTPPDVVAALTELLRLNPLGAPRTVEREPELQTTSLDSCADNASSGEPADQRSTTAPRTPIPPKMLPHVLKDKNHPTSSWPTEIGDIGQRVRRRLDEHLPVSSQNVSRVETIALKPIPVDAFKGMDPVILEQIAAPTRNLDAMVRGPHGWVVVLKKAGHRLSLSWLPE